MTLLASRREAQARTISAPAMLVPVGAVAWLCVATVWGRRLQRRVVDVRLGAAPLVGRWHWRPSLRLVPAIALGALLVVVGPAIAQRLRFGALVAVSATFAALFAGALAAADGGAAILAPVVHLTEYWAAQPHLPPAGKMLHAFGTRAFLVNYSPHVKGHPPGFLLLIKALAALGLGAPWATGALSFVGVMLLIVGALVTVRSVAGDVVARAYAPFVVGPPFAVWLITSADALYSGACAVGIALVAVGARAARERAGVGFCGAGGTALGAALFLSYGVTTIAPLAIAVAFVATGKPWPTRIRRVAAVGAGVIAVVLLFRHAGFWWFDGLRTTRGLYWEGTAKFRPWTYFLVGNGAALLIALGPAFAVALGRLRRDRVALVVGCTLACVAIADLSQYSKGEVERIWLIFMPWLLLAVVWLRRTRLWLGAQVATALVLQAWLVSKW